jgi:hypothetical protein
MSQTAADLGHQIVNRVVGRILLKQYARLFQKPVDNVIADSLEYFLVYEIRRFFYRSVPCASSAQAEKIGIGLPSGRLWQPSPQSRTQRPSHVASIRTML